VLDEIGFDLDFVFDSTRVKPWRTLDDRENCTLDIERENGQFLRLHVKRFPPRKTLPTDAENEVHGLRLLAAERVPSTRLVASGQGPDLRSFVAVEDLTGYQAADKLIEAGTPFQTLLNPIADLAAFLHERGLHHRDLYLCHFFVTLTPAIDVRLIDAARVARLPGLFMRQRWIVKDLAQLWFSTLALPVTDAQRLALFTRYCARRKLVADDLLLRSIHRKVRWIQEHDRKLNQRQPHRNISIPDE
jgi:heptose I phosphotransferase